MFNGVNADFCEEADLELTSVNENIIEWIIVLIRKALKALRSGLI